MKDLVAERIPWVVYEAADWLRETIKPDWSIFEWGSGGSTTFFLSLGAHVVTVEHTEQWYKKVYDTIVANKDGTLGRWTPVLSRPYRCIDIAPPVGSLRHPGDFSEYAGAIIHRRDLDLVFVDGRARNHCAKLAAPRIKPGGWLVLDNSDRADYKPTFDLLKDWAMVEFYGHGPLSDILWKTTMWRKPGGTP